MVNKNHQSKMTSDQRGCELKNIVKFEHAKLCLIWGAHLLILLWAFTTEGALQEDQTGVSGENAQIAEIEKTLKTTIETQQKAVTQLQEQFKDVQSRQKFLTTELNAYKLQLSAYKSMLLVSETNTEDLEQALADSALALNTINERLNKVIEKSKAVEKLRPQTNEQYMINQTQLKEFGYEGSKGPEARAVTEDLQLLAKTLSEKRSLLEQLEAKYTEEIDQLKGSQKGLADLTEKLKQTISVKKKRTRFVRTGNLLTSIEWGQLGKDLQMLVEKMTAFFSTKFLANQLNLFWQAGRFLLVTSFLLLGGLLVFLVRVRRFCFTLRQRPTFSQYPWRCFTLQLASHSVLLLGVTLFLYFYGQIQSLYTTIPIYRIGVYILIILLATRWGLDVLKLWPQYRRDPIPKPLYRHLLMFLYLTRIFAIAYVITLWLLGAQSVLLLLWRLLFEILLLVWNLSFWRLFRNPLVGSFVQGYRGWLTLKSFLIGLSYTVAGVGLILEMAGYGALALFWYLAWGRTAVVSLWAGLLYLLVHEWDRETQKTLNANEDGSLRNTHPYRWMFIRFCWLLWLVGLVVSLLLAWGARQALIVNLIRAFNHSFAIGKMSFSLSSVLHAALILLVTHGIVGLWRYFFQKKILSRSGIETGLQASVTSITVYIIWAIGILLALNAFGLSPTTLAIAFGALGIGLGFGLQNIFNNFVSGIILLFERPIQVGDDIEINGTWASVKKINVRSTVVQTYDNAALIIPNSDFISSQVTNWSFKDLRLRRKITVGVAYGSDIERVRQTLLEIAAKTPNVLKYPKPDVLFADFGDSALIFTLRIWTTINYMLIVETDVRFEIDRLFRERNIEIAFPQRDIHIRSAEKTLSLPPQPDNL
jgi:small-conductance mechanosensitive channel